MKCRKSRKLAAHQVGALPAAESHQLERHLRHCSACQAEMAALDRTAAWLTPAPLVAPPPEVWPQIHARLRPRRRSVGVPVPAWRPALAAAMVLVVILGVVFLGALGHHGTLPFAPAGETEALDQAHLAASWDTPLADREALGLAMLAMLDERPVEGAAN